MANSNLYVHLVVADIPGSGKGYRAAPQSPSVAEKPAILRGSLIVEEKPWFIIAQGPDREQRIEQAIARLETEEPGQFLEFSGLVVSHQFLSLPNPLAMHRGRFLTNALPCGPCAGIFIFASRFNSSCRPNVHYNWDEARKVMQFRAMRDIKPLEELCIAYNVKDLLQPRTIRQQEIRKSSGFDCSCPACITPFPWDATGITRQIFSDNTREWLRKVILPQAPLVQSDRHRIDNIVEALVALDRDGLYHYRDTLFYDGFVVCANAGDGNNAMLWLNRAYDAAVAVVGNDDPRVMELRNLMATRNAASFGARTILKEPPNI